MLVINRGKLIEMTINRNLFSLWRRANARNIRLCYPYWQYTDLFIFRCVSLLCLRSTRLYIYIYIYIYTVYLYIYIHIYIYIYICHCMIIDQKVWCLRNIFFAARLNGCINASVAQSVERCSRDLGSRVKFQAEGLGVARSGWILKYTSF